MTRLNPLFCHSGLWRASTRVQCSGSASAVSESCLQQGPVAFIRSSRAAVWCLMWIATTTSHPRGPWNVPFKNPSRVGSGGHFRLERPHLGSEPQARWPAVAHRLPAFATRAASGDSDPLDLREARLLPNSVPGHRARCSRPVVAGESGRRLQAPISRVKCE